MVNFSLELAAAGFGKAENLFQISASFCRKGRSDLADSQAERPVFHASNRFEPRRVMVCLLQLVLAHLIINAARRNPKELCNLRLFSSGALHGSFQRVALTVF